MLGWERRQSMGENRAAQIMGSILRKYWREYTITIVEETLTKNQQLG